MYLCLSEMIGRFFVVNTISAGGAACIVGLSISVSLILRRICDKIDL